MGLTERGFIRRTYAQILDDKIRRAKDLFGEDVYTGDQGALGKFLRIDAYDQARLEEQLEAVYLARFPGTASGVSLDRLAIFAGISRNPATAASYRVRITGTVGYAVPIDFLVGTDTGLTYYTAEDTAIGEGGTCEATVYCTLPGTVGNVSARAINSAVNPDADISAVEGIECIAPGEDEESDAELRARFSAAVAGSGSCNANAIRAALLRVPTVKFADVIENDADEADSEGRPPHSFECYVLCDEAYRQQVAETIWDKRPIGIQTTGDIAVNVTDASGGQKTVHYSNAKNVNIAVRVRIKTNADYPADGAQRVQATVTEYINSLGIGRSLVLSTIYGYIYAVPGVVEVTELTIGIDGGGHAVQNAIVPKYGVAVCSGVEVIS